MKYTLVILITFAFVTTLGVNSVKDTKVKTEKNNEETEVDEFAFDSENEDVVDDELVREKRSPLRRGGGYRGGYRGGGRRSPTVRTRRYYTPRARPRYRSKPSLQARQRRKNKNIGKSVIIGGATGAVAGVAMNNARKNRRNNRNDAKSNIDCKTHVLFLTLISLAVVRHFH